MTDLEIDNAVAALSISKPVILLKDEPIDMCLNLLPKTFFKNKRLGDYWCPVNTATRHSKLNVTVKPFLLAFSSLYMVEAGLVTQMQF